jgi:hypothetical protein
VSLSRLAAPTTGPRRAIGAKEILENATMTIISNHLHIPAWQPPVAGA